MAIVRLLRSARFARAVLVYLAALCGVAAFLPWVRGVDGSAAPAWAVAIGFDQPFSSWWFLAGVAALFASTLACTWTKPARTLAQWRGILPAGAVRLPTIDARDPIEFLRARGFRGDGVMFRYRFALWAGLILHWGLLALIAGVGVQQSFHDEGNFELLVGEQKDLSVPGAVFGRAAGPLAPVTPPAMLVALDAFDPFRHQPGFAPDHFSSIAIGSGAHAQRFAMDRAAGVEVDGVEVFQAIPAGLGAVVSSASGQQFALALHEVGPRTLGAAVSDARGVEWRLVVATERDVDDSEGTGEITAAVQVDGVPTPVQVGVPFAFGDDTVTIVRWTRWAGFHYARNPGMIGVYVGFVLVLLGSALLTFPAGLARPAGAGDVESRVFVLRGADALRLEWERGDP